MHMGMHMYMHTQVIDEETAHSMGAEHESDVILRLASYSKRTQLTVRMCMHAKRTQLAVAALICILSCIYSHAYTHMHTCTHTCMRTGGGSHPEPFR